MKYFIFLSLLISLYTQIIFAQDGQTAKIPTIAVNNLEAQGVTENEAATLSDVLRNKLINTGKYQVMERGEMETILKEQAFQSSGACSEAACIVEMGQVLGIQQVLAGSIGKVGRAYSISARIISVESGEIVKSVSHHFTGPIEDLLTSEMDVVVNKLISEQTVFSEKGSLKRKKDKSKLKRNLLITGGLVVVGGGVAAVLILTGDDEPQEEGPGFGSLEVTWQ